MDKEIRKSLIAIGVIFLIIGFLLGVTLSLIPEKKCIRSPLNYGISQLEQGNLKVTCSCYFNDLTYSPFFFNETGVFPYGK